MGARRKFALISIGFASILTAALAVFYLRLAGDTLWRQYREDAQRLATTFADRTSFYLSQGRLEDIDLLVDAVALGNVLYAQVTHEGRVVRSVARIPVELPEEEVVQARSDYRRPRQGSAYLDVIQPLHYSTGQGPSRSYVRLGLSLEPLYAQLRTQQLSVLGISLALVTLASLTILFLSRYFIHERAAPAVEPAPSAAITPATEPATAAPTGSALVLGALTIDDAAKRVKLRDQPIELSPKEYDLLKLLASQPSRVFSNKEILACIWPDRHLANAQDVKQYIYFLRQKLEDDPEQPQRIVTVRGFGYKLQP